jgi:anti-sigma regulatory factor (Ser/Thr protein kinase)
MSASPALELTLAAKAENVAIVRHAVAGLAEALEMGPPNVADLKTAVTEASMNVVVHAYEDGVGPLEVTAHSESDALVVVVRDFGGGIRPRAENERHSLRLGLPLIAALTESFAISGGPGRGTEVRMRMGLSRNGDGPGRQELELPVGSATEVSMPAGELLAPVLSRVISILAARANFSIDRLSDAVLLGDAISAHAPDDFPEGTARIAVEEDNGSLLVKVGPLLTGAGDRLLGGMRIPQIGGSLERLADEIRVAEEQGNEYILLRISPLPTLPK